MKNDKVLIAMIIGSVSTVAYEIITQIFVVTGIAKYSLYQLDSFIITLNRQTYFIGIMISFIVASFSSAIFYYLILKVGAEHLLIKSISFALLIWAVLEAFFMVNIENRLIDPRPISDYYNHMIGAMGYGIVQGLLYKKFLFKSIKK